ncbi:MAG: histone deacetylase family protein [Pseudomonadota bacterium]
MSTLLVSHHCFLDHDTGHGHPERADRLRAIEKALSAPSFKHLVRMDAPKATVEQISLAHPKEHIAFIEKHIPDTDKYYLDGDTVLSPQSWEAILRSAGAGILAVDEVMAGRVKNAFCAVRPPGHHAERHQAMGFCFLNNIAIAAYHAKTFHHCERIAIIDFDVHHGNGTQDIFWDEKDVFYGSTHEMPLFPGTGLLTEIGADNIFNAPLAAFSGGDVFRQTMQHSILKPLQRFAPDFIFISAGFDAHADDPLATLTLDETDFSWITQELVDIAEKTASGRLVSMLEGGYDLNSLARSVAAHVLQLMKAN